MRCALVQPPWAFLTVRLCSPELGCLWEQGRCGPACGLRLQGPVPVQANVSPVCVHACLSQRPSQATCARTWLQHGAEVRAVWGDTTCRLTPPLPAFGASDISAPTSEAARRGFLLTDGRSTGALGLRLCPPWAGVSGGRHLCPRGPASYRLCPLRRAGLRNGRKSPLHPICLPVFLN